MSDVSRSKLITAWLALTIAAALLSSTSSSAQEADPPAPGTATIFGLLTDALTTDPAAGVPVVASTEVDGLVVEVETTSDADGVYRLENLPLGDYRVEVRPEAVWLNEWVNTGEHGLPLPATFSPEAGRVTRFDVALDQGSSVRGLVTAQIGGRPLHGIDVAVAANGIERTATTGADGTYELSGLMPEPSTVTAIANATVEVFAPDGREVDLRADRMATVDFQLGPGGRFVGMVTDRSGAALSDVEVAFFDPRNRKWAVTTDDSGRYRSPGLPVGDIRLLFRSSNPAYLQLAIPGADVGDVAPMVMPDFTTTLDVVLVSSGSVSGTVRTPEGQSPVGKVVRIGDGPSGGEFVFVQPDGTYFFDGLLPGRYVVEFVGGDDILSAYHPRGPGFAAATVVDLEQGGVLTGVDIEVEAAGAITGRVVDPEGDPIEDARVVISAPDSRDLLSTVTGPDGTFALDDVHPGNVLLFVDDFTAAYLYEYFDDALAADVADLIAVGAGVSVDVGDIALSRGATITGTVRGPGGDPVAGQAALYSSHLEGGWIANATVDPSGMFAFEGVDIGGFLIEFVPADDAAHEITWSGDAMARADAEEVVVETRDDRRQIDIEVVAVTAPDPTPEPAPVAVVIAGESEPPAGDLPMLDVLDALGVEYSVVDDDRVSADDLDPNTVDVVILTSSVRLSSVPDILADLPLPIVSSEPYLHDELSIAAFGRETFGTYDAVELVDDAHPLASLLNDSTVVFTSLHRLSSGRVTDEAAVIASVPGQPEEAVLFEYRTGAELIDGSPAASCRIGVFTTYQSTSALTEVGVSLLTGAIERAIECDAAGEPTPPVDVDGDDFAADIDCNDDDPFVYPGADEVADDGIDQDCDGEDLVTPPEPPIRQRVVVVVGNPTSLTDQEYVEQLTSGLERADVVVIVLDAERLFTDLPSLENIEVILVSPPALPLEL